MYYTLSIENNHITGIATSEHPFMHNLTEDEKEDVIQLLSNRPQAEEGYQYELRADNYEWELVPIPTPSEDDEITDEEALAIIMGGAE